MFLRSFLFLLLLFLIPVAPAQTITPYLEMLVVNNVGESWQNIPLENSYSDPVIVCTYNLVTHSHSEAVVRVRLSGATYQLKVQRPPNLTGATTSDVYCTVSESGSYTHPIKYEAHKVVSSNNNSSGRWQLSYMENVTTSKVQNYTKPVVIGQVMSENNADFSVFWSTNCSSRSAPPTNSGICVGKHTGGSGIVLANSETLAYIIAEEQEYTMANAYVKIALGSDSVAGTKNSPPYAYSLPRNYSFATATQSAEDGGNGGWAVLYGSSPVNSQLSLAIEEETTGADSSRKHTKEQVAYWVMDPINKSYADLMINEVLYLQTGGQAEFVELYALSSGSVLNYVISGQDGTAQNDYLPDFEVTAGDYIVVYSGSGTNQTSSSPYIIYTGGSASILQNTADDIVILKPSASDVTALNGSGSVNATPVDYVSYGVGGSIDTIPVSMDGVSPTWNSADNTRLGGAAAGQSISLTRNATDTDSSICWELTTSGDASACPSFIITRDTDPTTFIHSVGANNTAAPEITLMKTLTTIYDPYNVSV